MPSLFNRSQGNAFGFPAGTNGEVDETRAAVQPKATPFVNKPQNFLDNFTSRFRGASEGYEGFSPILKYLSGQGDLSVSQNDSKDEPLSRFSIGPGGTFNLQNLQSGFSVSGDPSSKSIGMHVPVNIGGNKGTIGVEGSWNPFDPSIGAKFTFGGDKEPGGFSPEQTVTTALGPEQQTETRSELSAREQADQLISAFRSSGGRDSNSPSTWQY
jgi:hypothetical protein